VTLFYSFVCSTINIVLKLFFHFTSEGGENIPRSGAFIVAANHVSYLDPPIMGALFFGKQINFMAKSELFEVPLLSFAIRRLGAFPVVRESADTKALKHAIALLKEGRIVGIFPEGKRSSSGEILEGELGIALIAKQTKAPLIPCAIIGSYHPVRFKGIIPTFAKIHVRIGKPLFFEETEQGPSNKERMRNFTAKVMDELKCLINE
jgi:1-acyl-sn-glycerol-3-phosphate acyltransferase